MQYTSGNDIQAEHNNNYFSWIIRNPLKKHGYVKPYGTVDNKFFMHITEDLTIYQGAKCNLFNMGVWIWKLEYMFSQESS